jgi:hypothetical protein
VLLDDVWLMDVAINVSGFAAAEYPRDMSGWHVTKTSRTLDTLLIVPASELVLH